jgi:RNA polymerase sigma factor (sigma-70 family)
MEASMTSRTTTEPANDDSVCTQAAIVRALPTLRRFARSLAKDSAAADDLAHDCVVKALENMDKFQPGTNLRAWLFTILRNCFISGIRRDRRRFEECDGPDWATRGSTPPNQECRILLRRVGEEIADLPPDQRAVLRLVVLESRSYDETARALDVPVGTVRSRLSRARQALRAATEGGTELPEQEQRTAA